MSLAENKFLIGYGVVVALAAGALGYLTLKEKGRYQTALTGFNTKVSQYNNFRSKPLALTKENLEKLEGQTRLVTETAVSLRDQLAGMNLPLEPITPTAFQDLLRARVSEVTRKAEQANVTLPNDFYLGFNQYQNQPPRNEATSALLRQLKVIEQALNTLIDNGVNTISALSRQPLPEESTVAAATTPSPARTPAKPNTPAQTTPAPGTAVGKEMKVERFPFHVTFSSHQANIRRALNALVATKDQFLIITPELIANSNDKSISRAAVQAPTPTPTQEGTASQPESPGTQGTETSTAQLQYIVGNEIISVRLRIDMAIFDTAEEPTRK